MRTFNYNYNGQEVTINLVENGETIAAINFPTLDAAKDEMVANRSFEWALGKENIPLLTDEELTAYNTFIQQQE